MNNITTHPGTALDDLRCNPQAAVSSEANTRLASRHNGPDWRGQPRILQIFLWVAVATMIGALVLRALSTLEVSPGNFAIAAALALLLYLLPTCVASVRRHPNLGMLATVNILFGWTLIGWGLSLAGALFGRKRESSSASH